MSRNRPIRNQRRKVPIPPRHSQIPGPGSNRRNWQHHLPGHGFHLDLRLGWPMPHHPMHQQTHLRPLQHDRVPPPRPHHVREVGQFLFKSPNPGSWRSVPLVQSAFADRTTNAFLIPGERTGSCLDTDGRGEGESRILTGMALIESLISTAFTI